MSRTIPTIFILAALLFLVGPPDKAGAADVYSQPVEWSPWGAGAPKLGNTRFMSTTFAPDPFIRTSLRAKLGYGGANDVRVTVLDLGDSLELGLEGDMLYAHLDLRYQHAIQNWLAVHAGIRLSTRLGNELESLLAQGVSLFTGFNLGWMVSVWEADRHLLSTSLSLNNTTTTLVDFYGYLEDVIDDQPDPSLIKDIPRLNGSIDLRYAFAATGMLGIQGYGKATYGETLERGSENRWFYTVAVTLHLDLARRTAFPVGLLGGYKYLSAQDPDGMELQGTHSTVLNVSYTGRPDFTFGVDLMYEVVPLRGFDEDAGVVTLMASIWYYF